MIATRGNVMHCSQAGAGPCDELADQDKADSEKSDVKSSGHHVAPNDDLLDNDGLKRERFHLQVVDDAKRGLDDIEAGRTAGGDAAIARLQQRRAAAANSPATTTTGMGAIKRC